MIPYGREFAGIRIPVCPRGVSVTLAVDLADQSDSSRLAPGGGVLDTAIDTLTSLVFALANLLPRPLCRVACLLSQNCGKRIHPGIQRLDSIEAPLHQVNTATRPSRSRARCGRDSPSRCG
jgi:hypothetical protein